MSSQQPTKRTPRHSKRETWRSRQARLAQPQPVERERRVLPLFPVLVLTVLILVGVDYVIFSALGFNTSQLFPAARNPTPFATDASLSTPPLASAPTDTPVPTAPGPTVPAGTPTSSIVKYRVRTGDTLFSLAVKYNVSVRAIMVANGLRGETIYEGQELIIPQPTSP